ncbi:MAG: hypothetical protein ABSF52_07215 [Syntrophobacteraceae bacterium]|jgi:hypothetical protein
MKGTAFLFIILISALLFAEWRAPIASSSEGSGTLLRIQSLENRIGPPPRQLLADRTDTQDDIIYSTDPRMDRAMEEQARKEQEKEDKAWNMLQNMYLNKDIRKSPKSTQPDNAPQK